MMKLAEETLERLRGLAPEDLLETARRLALRSPDGGGSDDYAELLEELVREGLVSWEQIEMAEDSVRVR